MKRYEMLPTEENLIETLYNDTINRNKDIVYFYDILQLMEDGEAERRFLLGKQKWLSMH